MNTEPRSRARRVVALVLPLLALLALVLVGRRATIAAPLTAAVVGPTAADAAVEAAVRDADGASTQLTVEAVVAPEAAPPRVAIEHLADGGFLVDLNLASEDELRKLPGIGPARARRIVELRARLGRFKSVDDLARIKGFGKATLRRLRALTKVGA